jgi:hypothetical protein
LLIHVAVSDDAGPIATDTYTCDDHGFDIALPDGATGVHVELTRIYHPDLTGSRPIAFDVAGPVHDRALGRGSSGDLLAISHAIATRPPRMTNQAMGYSGMLPCLRGGFVSRLFLSVRSAPTIVLRVSRGRMISSM